LNGSCIVMEIEAPFTEVSSNMLSNFHEGFRYDAINGNTNEDHQNRPEQRISALSNISIPISYFLVGFGDFMITPLSVYMVHTMGAQPWQQNTMGVITLLPWSFKIFYGFLSDVRPIAGLHRKPYFALGYCIQTCCYFLLTYLSSSKTNGVSFECLASLMFVLTFGTIMADVMADTLVVEHSARTEQGEASRGQVQTTCYGIRFFGSMLGNLLGTVLYNQASWGWGLEFWQVTGCLGLIPWVILFPTIPYLYEAPEKDLRPIRQQIADIWDMCQQKAVWKPMAFVYIYNLFQVPCVAWLSFLQLGLNFQPWALGMLNTAGAVVATLGIVTFKYCFFQSSWRSIYIGCTLLVASLSVLQVLLVLRWNVTIFHVPDFFFALGDNVVAAYVNGIQYLPICIMYLQLCPRGSEGASYALLTTFGNMASTMAVSIGTSFASIWDVSNGTLSQHKYHGLLFLSLLTSLLQPLPLLLIRLLPSSPEKAQELKDSQVKSRLGGFVFISVLIASLLYATWEALAVVLTS